MKEEKINKKNKQKKPPKHQNPIKDRCTQFLSLFPKVYFRIPKQWALQTALQRLNSANISDTYWANIRTGPVPVYTAPSYLVSISHESFTAGKWDLQCSRNPKQMSKRPRRVLKTPPWGLRLRSKAWSAINLLGRARTLHKFQNLWIADPFTRHNFHPFIDAPELFGDWEIGAEIGSHEPGLLSSCLW